MDRLVEQGQKLVDSSAYIQKRFLGEALAQGLLGQFAAFFQFPRRLLADGETVVLKVREKGRDAPAVDRRFPAEDVPPAEAPPVPGSEASVPIAW